MEEEEEEDQVFDDTSTDDQDEESIPDNDEDRSTTEESDIDPTTTKLTTEMKEFMDHLLRPILIEMHSNLDMENEGIVKLWDALIDYLDLVQKCCGLTEPEEVERLV